MFPQPAARDGCRDGLRPVSVGFGSEFAGAGSAVINLTGSPICCAACWPLPGPLPSHVVFNQQHGISCARPGRIGGGIGAQPPATNAALQR